MGNEDQPRDEHGRWTSGGSSGEALAAWSEHMAGHRDLAAKLGMRETSPKKFKAAFEKAFKDNAFSAFVSHYSKEELAGMKCLLSKDGKVGLAVHDHGDGRIEGTAVFNSGDTRGAGSAALCHAIANHGVNYVECYGGHLDKAYEKLGFKEESRSPFNREYASPNWNYEKFGTPDYVTMRHTSKR